MIHSITLQRQLLGLRQNLREMSQCSVCSKIHNLAMRACPVIIPMLAVANMEMVVSFYEESESHVHVSHERASVVRPTEIHL